MNIKVYVICLTILLTSSTHLFSQKFYREGYIVKNNGDTLQGLIQYNEGRIILDKCVFKRFDIATPIAYEPTEISGYGYNNGNVFESKVIEGERLFAECIIKGYISVYTLRKKIYIEKEDVVYPRLISGEITYYTQDAELKVKGFREMLKIATSDSKEFEIPRKIKLNADEIALALVEYNKKTNGNYTLYNRFVDAVLLEDPSINDGIPMSSFGITGALSITGKALALSGRHFDPIPQMDYSNTYGAIGISYNRKLSRMKKNVSIQTEIFLTHQSSFLFVEASRTYPTQAQNIEIYSSLTKINVPILIRYAFKHKKLAPFANVGISTNFQLSNKRDGVLESVSNNYLIESYGYKESPLNQNDEIFSGFGGISGIGGIGLKYKLLSNFNLVLESRLEFTPKSTQYFEFDYYYAPTLSYSHKPLNLFFLVGIEF